jgi:hypothetical protein
MGKNFTVTKLAGRYRNPNTVMMLKVLASFLAFDASARARAASSAESALLV